MDTSYTVYSNQGINWNAKGHERILQNIANLLSTFVYEVAYDRVKGRDPANLDKPLDKMIPAVIAEAYDLIQEYEPRVNIETIEATVIDGEVVTKVVVKIG